MAIHGIYPHTPSHNWDGRNPFWQWLRFYRIPRVTFFIFQTSMQIFWFDLFLKRCGWGCIDAMPQMYYWTEVFIALLCFMVCWLCIFLASTVSFFRKLLHRHSVQSYLQPNIRRRMAKEGGEGDDEVFAAKKPHIFYGMRDPQAGME